MRGPLERLRAYQEGRVLRRARELRERADRQVAAFDDAGAWASLQSALSLRPDSASATLRAARVARRLGRSAEARALWAQVAAREPERVEAWVARAWLSLWAGELEAARAQAERALALQPAGGPFSDAHGMRHLVAHVDARLAEGAIGSQPPSARQVVLGGISYSGSTLLGYLLGALPGVANVGESHWLVNRREGPVTLFTDFDSPEPAERSACNHCGPTCSAFPDAFRRALAEDPVDWYAKIATRLGAGVLVSSDKNPPKLRVLDPGLRFDLVIAFRRPSVSWSSTRRKSHVTTPLEQHLRDWHDTHATLLDALPNRGRVVCLHFDALRADPEPHLRRLCQLLDLPFAAEALALGSGPPQHTFGGNPRAHRSLAAERPEIERTADPLDLPPEEAERVAEFEARSAILPRLLEAHERDFGRDSG